MELRDQVLSFYIAVLLCGGAVALVREFRGDAREPANGAVPAWKCGLLTFAQFAWLVLTSLLVTQAATAQILHAAGIEGSGPWFAWRVAITGAVTHLSVLAVFIVGRRFAPGVLPLPASEAGTGWVWGVGAGVRNFLAGFPLVWLTSWGWAKAFDLWSKAGFPAVREPQFVVRLLMETDSPAFFGFMAIVAIVVAPVTEELVFRAGLYRFLKGRMRARWALVVSAFVFALIHFNGLSFVPLLLLGMLLGRAYERSRSLLAPITFHALFNANTFLVMLLKPEALERLTP